MVKRRMKDRGNISLRSDLGLWPQQNDEDENQTFLLSFMLTQATFRTSYVISIYSLLIHNHIPLRILNILSVYGENAKIYVRLERKRNDGESLNIAKTSELCKIKHGCTHSIIEMWWWIGIWDGDAQTRLYNTKHGNLRRLSEIYTATQYVFVSNFVAYQSQKYTHYPSLRRKQSLKNLSQTMA